MKSRIAAAIASAWGAGYFPKGPGTAGSLVAIAIALVMKHPAMLAAVVVLPAVWAADAYARERGVKDPQTVVIDEVIGQWIALVAVPSWSWIPVAAAFVLFRFFDIVKPWPVRQFEKLPGGWGIVMDDVMAGVYAGFVTLSLRWFNLIS